MQLKIFLLLVSITLFSADINNFFKEMKKIEHEYQDENKSQSVRDTLTTTLNIKSKDELVSEYNTTIETLQKNTEEAINKAIPWMSKSKLFSDVNKQDLEIIMNTLKNDNSQQSKKVDTVFYLFSTSQDNYSFYHFIKNVSKLENVHKDIKYYGVVQGIIPQIELEKLYQPFKFEKTLSEKSIIKMHPFMYKDLELKQVPAYLFSKCPASEFKYKECENKFLVRGDISLSKALEIVSNEDKSYLKYLNFLEKGNN